MTILNENGNIYLHGMMSKADVKNRNGRIYPKLPLKAATLRLAEDVRSNKVWSEKEHPSYFDVKFNDRVCGQLTEVTWNEDESAAFCKVKLLETTSAGKEIINAVKNKETVGISTRGKGSLSFNESLNAHIVNDDLVFATADIIYDGIQSCQTCILDLHEAKEEFFIDDQFFELNESCSCQLTDEEKKIARNHLTEQICAIFK